MSRAVRIVQPSKILRSGHIVVAALVLNFASRFNVRIRKCICCGFVVHLRRVKYQIIVFHMRRRWQRLPIFAIALNMRCTLNVNLWMLHIWRHAIQCNLMLFLFPRNSSDCTTPAHITDEASDLFFRSTNALVVGISRWSIIFRLVHNSNISLKKIVPFCWPLCYNFNIYIEWNLSLSKQFHWRKNTSGCSESNGKPFEQLITIRQCVHSAHLKSKQTIRSNRVIT